VPERRDPRRGTPGSGPDPRRPTAPRARGHARAARRRVADADLARGPGNLTRAFGIDGAHDGIPLDRPPLWIAAVGLRPAAAEVVVGPRIGLGAKNPARDWPLRYALVGEAAVSGRRRP
jgi:DNA-3-methyladenine glycosylase